MIYYFFRKEANKIRALNVVIILNDIKICNKYLFIT